VSARLGVALIVCSDRAARGERPDATAARLRTELEAAGHELLQVTVVADERATIAAALREQAARPGVNVVLTTGGTGIGPRDVTVEATLDVLERLLPGMAEAMRARSLSATPMAMLSRAAAGTLGRAVVVNLPGSPRGALQCLQVVLPALPHACSLLAGGVEDCQA
jgi:molybdenum cofactor synthesis domain-containing protein